MGATVMALYLDTSCFYRAEVLASASYTHSAGWVSPFHSYEVLAIIEPKWVAQGAQSKPMYKLMFEGDGDQEHSVSAQLVIEWPG